MFRIKEKRVSGEGEQSTGVATEPFLAIETPGNISSCISSFFRAELRAIKQKQVQYDRKQEKILTQLASMDKLLYFALIMLKKMSPSEPSNPPIPTLALAAGTLSQAPTVEPPAPQLEP